jgi:type II secretory pathway pseudopilin PulG
MKKAFTLLEMLLVFTIMGLSFGLAVLYAQVSQLRADLHGQADSFVSYVRLAQSDAASGKHGLAHGVRVESDSYTLFSGAVYDPLDPLNILVELPPTIEIQNIALNGGGSDLIFTIPYGETDTYGSLNFTSLSTGETVLITIYANGILDY